MRNTTLLLTIILTFTVSSQAQTVQKRSYLLKSHVIKKQKCSPINGIIGNNFLVDSLTTERRLMMMPINNDLFYRINASLNSTNIKSFKANKIEHELLYSTLKVFVKNWYIGTYCRECDGIHMGLQLPLNYRTNIWEAGGVLLQPTSNPWNQF